MNYWTIILVAVALGVDTFSIAVSLGLGKINLRQILTFSGMVTGFHIFMPLLGLYLGAYLGGIAGDTAGTIGALVLIGIGVTILWKSLLETRIVLKWTKRVPKAPDTKQSLINLDNPFSLLLLCASVSLDALTVGFGLGTLRVDLGLTVLTIGIMSGLMTLTGFLFGKKLKLVVGEGAEIAGGLILLALGLKILML